MKSGSEINRTLNSPKESKFMDEGIENIFFKDTKKLAFKLFLFTYLWGGSICISYFANEIKTEV